MLPIVRIHGTPRDYSGLVDGVGHCALKKARSCARDVNGADGAIGSAHETMRREARVQVVSHDHAVVIDGQAVAGDRPRRAKSSDGAVGSADEAAQGKSDATGPLRRSRGVASWRLTTDGNRGLLFIRWG